MAEEASETAKLPVLKAQTLQYCEVCGFPPEYCLYGSRFSKCKAALQKSQPALFERLYGGASSSADVQEVTEGVEKVKVSSLDKEAAKKEAKAEAKEEKARERLQSSKVTIKRIERNKRKHVTAIHGLEVFGIDLKKASKLFSNRFATGASVSKNNQGEDEIVIQGDVAYDVEELLFDTSPKIAEILGGGKLIPEEYAVLPSYCLELTPSSNVIITDEGKKKAS